MKRGDDAATTPLVPMEQFRDFVRRIVSVPKTEIDRKLAARRQRRSQRDAKK